LAFRVDAGPVTGTGHAMRCLALAEAWKDLGNQTMFVMAESLPAFDDRVKQEGMRAVKIASRQGTPEDARETARTARDAGSRWIVLDGYQFDAAFQEALKAAGLSVLALDDYGHAGRYAADIVLNQNLHARTTLYRDRAPTTRLLLGPRYALLRREFRRHKGVRREPRSKVEEILLTIGGVNRNQVTSVLLRGLGKVDGRSFKITIVPGMKREAASDLKIVAKELRLQVQVTADARDMADLMANADLALAGAGTTAWELAYMGVPSLLTVLAENQREVAESLDRKGVAQSLGPSDTLTPEAVARAVRPLIEDPKRRAEMAMRARALVDGDGVDRVLRELSLPSLQLRPVREEDSRRIWEWRNEPGTTAASFSSDPIAWEDHVRWFGTKVADPQVRFYIASEAGGRSVGQIRFDLGGSEAEVSVSLDVAFRGRGYGAALIRQASQKLFDETSVETIHAYLKEANEASARAFHDAGFEDRGTKTVRGQRARHFALVRGADP
jgi:UDP-2,4-diacetamido-2,4,6-trideoxy-beta-L-altropyranose hydrolase